MALQATAALLLCGAAVLGINESYSKSSPNTSQNLQNDPSATTKHGGTLRSLKVETIEPVRVRVSSGESSGDSNKDPPFESPTPDHYEHVCACLC